MPESEPQEWRKAVYFSYIMELLKKRVSKLAVILTVFLSFVKFLNAEFLETINLPQALLSHTAIIYQNRIYVAGGVSDTGGIRGTGGFLNNVYYSAEINADGTLSEWRVANNMPEFLGLGLHSSVVYNGMIYVLGGTNMFGPRNVVYYASVNSDGSLGEWRTTIPMPNKLMGHSAVLYNNRIYVIGGIIRSVGATSDVFWGEILPDGTIDGWQKTTPLPHHLFGHRAVVIGRKIFVIGGTDAHTLYNGDGTPPSDVSAEIYSSEILSDGNLGEWQKVSELPKPLTFAGVTATSKNVYVIGGYDGTGISNAVYFAPIIDANTLGDWQSLDALPMALMSLASVSNEEYVYSLGGGITYIDGPQSKVYYMKIKQSLKAFVKIVPQTINKKSHGRWIMAIIGLPEGDVKDIVPTSVRITEINGQAITPIYADRWVEKIFQDKCDDEDCDDEDGSFRNEKLYGHKFRMFKFSRQEVAKIIPEGNITLKIEGSLKDGTEFYGENTNWVINLVKVPKKVLNIRNGVRKTPYGIEVDIPALAFPGNPDLILTVEPENPGEVSENEKNKRKYDRISKGLVEISSPIVFGPHGIQFETPITIKIPYNPKMIPEGFDLDDLKIYYWNSSLSLWEELNSQVSKSEHFVYALVSHFSVYQVMAGKTKTLETSEFSIGDVYVFPNPLKGSQRPKFRIEARGSDKFSIKIYTPSGRIVYEKTISGNPQLLPDDGNGSDYGYEYEINENLTSGVYYYYVEVSNGGKNLNKTGKFAVVR